MSRRTNKVWRLVKRPEGDIGDDNLALREEPLPDELKDGQVLFRTLLLSLDPTNRLWMSDKDQYMEPVKLNEVMRGLGISIVEESKNPKFPVGSLWSGVFGWQVYSLLDSPGEELQPLHPDPKLPLDAYLSVISVIIGCTAYIGLLRIGSAKPGETLVVSAAAGAVGSIVGQIGKLHGLRVVGIVGSDDKCQWIKKELGFDEAINYKKAAGVDQLIAALRSACPKGIDVYYDNVGGQTLDACLKLMNNNGRVVTCGLISSYNAQDPVPGPYNYSMILMRRLRVQGFIVLDHPELFPEALSNLERWVLEGKIKWRSDIVEGIENAQSALKKLFQGTNQGKLMVKVSDPEEKRSTPATTAATTASSFVIKT